MSDTIMRQIEMLRIIPRVGKLSPQQIQAELANRGYATTERTIQRDLIQLSRIYGLYCDDQSKPHGWKWASDSVAFQIPGLSVAEALAFQMLAQFDRELLPVGISDQLAPYFAAAKKQLSLEVGPKAAQNWVSKIRSVTPNQPLLAVTAPPEVLSAVHDALLNDCQLAIRYHSAQNAASIIHPLGLVQHGKTFYLVVNYDGYSDIRLLVVHRIRKAETLAAQVKTPSGFNLDEYIASGGLGFGEIGQSVKLELHFFNYAGAHLKETKLSKDQTEHDPGPGETVITATVQHTRRLQWWLRGFGGDVEVMEPAWLREQMRTDLEGALARYQAEPIRVRSKRSPRSA